MKWEIEDWIIFEARVGSQLYGTATEFSDADYRGVCIPPYNVRNSLLQNFEQKDGWGDECYKSWPKERIEDRVIYDLKKFFQMCLKGNPAIIEMLFIPENRWITPRGIVRKYEPWSVIVEKREIFLSKKVKFTFSGYAHSQLERIKRHRSWLLNPPKEQPTRERYELPVNPKLSAEQMGACLTLPDGIILEEYREEARKEKAYHEARTHWNMYMDWKKSRNKDRAQLEERFGYDTKHASHLVRLMSEGRELLMYGKISFPRPDAERLLVIKNGGYSYDDLLEETANCDTDFEIMYEKSPLPHLPDINRANDLFLDLIKK
jgi:hypothetical protein